MKRLDKQSSRKRWAELRDFWNEYDPIGVMGLPDSPRDEYESYVGGMMRLLEKDASVEQIVSYLESVIEHIGVEFDRERAALFAVGSKQWFEQNWRGTYV